MKILAKQSSANILSIDTIRKYQFALTFLAFHSIIRAEIHIGVNNSAVAVKNTTTLHCRDAYVNCSDHTSLKIGALWSLRMPGTTTKVVEISKIFPDRISTNATCIGQYDLTIRDVKFEDAGTYYCTTQHQLYTAQLIVIGNADEKKQITTNANDYARTGHGNVSSTPDNKLLLYGSLITLFVVVIAVLVTLSTVYIVKHCKDKEPKRHENANQGNDYYAEISQKGNASFNNMPLPLSNISHSHFDATSLSSRRIPNYPQRNQKNFEEDGMAAYSETRTIASVPVQFLSSRSMLSLNQAAPKSDSLGRTKGHMGPSVDSAMPVYAEVHKPKIPNDRGHISSSQRLSRSPSEDENQPMTSMSNIGADGTVYMQLGGKNNTANRSIPIPKKRQETAVYAMVDHTRRLPPPPPPE